MFILKSGKLFATVCLIAAVGTVQAETYYLSGAEARGNFSDVNKWTSASNTHPAYPPTSSSCSADDLFIVRNNLQTRDDYAGISGMQIYGKVVYGEVGGTAGRHFEESQYPRTNGAQINFRHADGATLANGTFVAGNTAASGWNNRYLGKLTVTAPKTAPFVFSIDGGRGADFECSFNSDASQETGIKFSGRAFLTFKGAWSGYHGALSFTKAGANVTFDTGVGTLDIDDLALAASMTVTVKVVSAPVKVKALTLGDGVRLNYSGALAEESGVIVANTATIQAQSLSQTGTTIFKLPTFSFTPSAGGSVRVPLLKSAAGGIEVENYEVIVADVDQVAYRGLAVDTVGDAQTLVAVFEWEHVYFLTGAASGVAQNYKSADYWKDGASVAVPYAPSDSQCDVPLCVRNSRTLSFDNGFTSSAMSPIYGQYVQIGEVGGTEGTLQFRLQYEAAAVSFMSPLYLANGSWYFQGGDGKTTKASGRAIVTATDDDPFLFTVRYQSPIHKFDMTFESEAGCAMKGGSSAAAAHFQFLRSLAGYKGTMDFSQGPRNLTFDTKVGVTDMAALKFATAATVTVNNVSAPLKAKALTVGANSLFNLKATTYGNGDAAVVSNSCLAAGSASVTGPESFKLTGSIPRIGQGARLKLLSVASGTLPTVDNFSVVDNTTGKAKLKNIAVVDDGEGQSLVASFEGKRGLLLVFR